MHENIALSETGQVLFELISSILSDKNKLKVTEKQTANSVFFDVKTSYRDYPKVLGRKKTNFLAIEKILQLMGEQDGKIVRFVLEQPSNPNAPIPEPFRRNNEFSKELFLPLIKDICGRIFSDGGIVNCEEINRNTLNFEILTNSSVPLTYRDDGGQDEISDSNFQTIMCAVFKAVGKNNGGNIYIEFQRFESPENKLEVFNKKLEVGTAKQDVLWKVFFDENGNIEGNPVQVSESDEENKLGDYRIKGHGTSHIVLAQDENRAIRTATDRRRSMKVLAK